MRPLLLAVARPHLHCTLTVKDTALSRNGYCQQPRRPVSPTTSQPFEIKPSQGHPYVRDIPNDPFDAFGMDHAWIRCSSSRASSGDYNSVCMRLCVSVQSGVCKHHQLACVKLITHVCCVCETGNGTILHTQNDESTSNSCNTVLHIYTIYTYILYTHIYYMYCYRCGAHVAPTRARHTRPARAWYAHVAPKYMKECLGNAWRMHSRIPCHVAPWRNRSPYYLVFTIKNACMKCL